MSMDVVSSGTCDTSYLAALVAAAKAQLQSRLTAAAGAVAAEAINAEGDNCSEVRSNPRSHTTSR
jgi:hypothetical protein